MNYGKKLGSGLWLQGYGVHPHTEQRSVLEKHLTVQKSGSEVGPGQARGRQKCTVPSQCIQYVVLKATCPPIHFSGGLS